MPPPAIAASRVVLPKERPQVVAPPLLLRPRPPQVILPPPRLATSMNVGTPRWTPPTEWLPVTEMTVSQKAKMLLSAREGWRELRPKQAAAKPAGPPFKGPPTLQGGVQGTPFKESLR